MKQTYTIIIDAKKSHQPSSQEIHAAVRELVDHRVRQFPPGKNTKKSGTRTTIIPSLENTKGGTHHSRRQ